MRWLFWIINWFRWVAEEERLDREVEAKCLEHRQ